MFAVMGVASIAPAFPEIQIAFSLEKDQVKWLISIFTVPGILLSPIAGVLADYYGRKAILVPSLLLFALGAFFCSLAVSYHQLLVFRFIQGVGAAALGALSITLIGDFFQGKERVKIMGLNASVLSISVASYPALGGFLTAFNWRYVFYLPVLSVFLIVLVLLKINKVELPKRTSLANYLSSLFKVVGQRQVLSLFSVNLLVFVVLYGAYLTFFASFLKSEFNASVIYIGLAMSFLSVVSALFSANISFFRKLFSPRSLLIFSSIVYIVGMLVLAFSHAWIVVFISLFIFGIGHGLLVPNMQTMLIDLSTTKERAAFMSLNGMVLRIGQFLGPVLISIFFIQDNFSAVFLAGAGASFIMLIVILLFIRN